MPDHYSERQAADILRRAALLQSRGEDASGPGLSIAEVKRAAEAAGIDGQYVEQAALGAGEDLPESEPFLGIQTGARRTRVVAGRVSDEEWGRMVAVLRRQLGGTGRVESIGGVRDWRRGPYHVLLEPEVENTRITASGEWRASTIEGALSPLMLLAFALILAVLGAVSADPAMWPLAGLMGAAGLGVGAFMWPRLWPKGPRIEGKLDRAMDALEDLAGADERAAVLADAPPLAESASPEATAAGSRLGASLLDADAPSPEAPGGAAPGRARTRT